MHRLLIASLALLCACGRTPIEIDSLDGTTTGRDPGGSSSSSTSDVTSGSSVDETGPALPDVMPDLPPGQCQSVSILFVVDNSLSMAEYQQSLALQWPLFVDSMWSELPAGSRLHVGLTTTSFYDGSCLTGAPYECSPQETPEEVWAHYVPPTQADLGENGYQGRLYEWDGRRYFEATVGEDSSDLKLWFSQAAISAGETGCSIEVPAAAAGYVFHAANAEYNTGFLADENSVLVIVALTDEPDKSPEGWNFYRQQVVNATGCDSADCVITSGIVDVCIEHVDDPLYLFLTSFEGYSGIGSIHAPTTYGDVVGAALAAVIGDACEGEGG